MNTSTVAIWDAKSESKRKLEDRKLKEVKYMGNKGMRKSACE